MNTYKTPKGTELPLLKLKGKDYMQVAHRLVWFNEEETHFTIDTKFILQTDTSATCQATIQILNDQGLVIKRAMATKSENTQGFADFAEKAETGSIGRALALIGYGTQHALADLDEGSRIVDSPVAKVEKPEPTKLALASAPPETVPPKKASSFRKGTQKSEETPVAQIETPAKTTGWE